MPELDCGPLAGMSPLLRGLGFSKTSTGELLLGLLLPAPKDPLGRLFPVRDMRVPSGPDTLGTSANPQTWPSGPPPEEPQKVTSIQSRFSSLASMGTFTTGVHKLRPMGPMQPVSDLCEQMDSAMLPTSGQTLSEAVSGATRRSCDRHHMAYTWPTKPETLAI